MSEVAQAQAELIEEFRFFDDWMDRYQYIIDLGRRLPEFPESLISRYIDNTWHDTAEAIINNWIGQVYQVTNVDRKQPFKEHIDPADPLGLKN